MSNESKESEKEKSERIDNRFLKFLLIWIPIMMCLVLLPSLSSDPNSLLTDEQKLEKQKEIADAKALKDQEWEDQVTEFDNGVEWFVHERPFPFNILIGFGIFYLVARGLNSSHRRGYESMMERFSNPTCLIPLTFGLFYLLWVSGELERLRII